MKRWIMVFVLTAALAGCRRYEPNPEPADSEYRQNEEIETVSERGSSDIDQEKLQGIEEELTSDTEEPTSGTKEERLSGEDKEQISEMEEKPISEIEEKPISEEKEGTVPETSGENQSGNEEGTPVSSAKSILPRFSINRKPVKVKGIYVSAYVAGMGDMMDEILRRIEETELNAVVIDVKDDNGRVTFDMDSPMVRELGACIPYISDIGSLAARLKEKDVYMIARIPAFRDPYLAEAKPEWCCKLADGSVYRDRNRNAWVNPYRKEVWDYLIEIAEEAGKAGFDEIQFDYIRFCTERGMDKVVFDEAETEGRSRQEIILEFTQYAYSRLAPKGLFVSADVFGAVIEGGEDARLVGQEYGQMAEVLDYICPMIYPSHYGDGYFGLDHPDTHPYETVLAALTGSKNVLAFYEELESGKEEKKTGTVRPWLQDFTASYLPHYIPYGKEQVREQVQAVYDAGYEEWILWNAGVRYHYDGLLTEERLEP